MRRDRVTKGPQAIDCANMPDRPPHPASIHAPWRMQYLESMGEAEKPAGPPKSSSGSFLRDYWLTPQDDEKNHVIFRTAKGFVCLNAYPYANGHLLVALGEPRSRILEYDPADRAALWQLTELAADLMELALE